MNTSLIILASLLAVSAAQMTFSDGWEKRSGARPYAHHYDHQKVARSGGHAIHESDEVAEAAGASEGRGVEEPTKNSPMTPITNCMEEYMAEVRVLHAAMVELYTRFQSCENAVTNPLLPGSHEKTSRARF